MSLSRRLTAEFIGTFWLVLGGCGAAVLAAGFPKLGIGFIKPGTTASVRECARMFGM